MFHESFIGCGRIPKYLSTKWMDKVWYIKEYYSAIKNENVHLATWMRHKLGRKFKRIFHL